LNYHKNKYDYSNTSLGESRVLTLTIPQFVFLISAGTLLVIITFFECREAYLKYYGLGPYQCENFIERQKCDDLNQGEENDILVELPINHIDNNNSE
jgi:hypothetical protein